MTEFAITRGLPYIRRIRLTNGKLTWATRDTFEVRSHIRTDPQVNTALIFDLSPYLTASYDGDDIVVDLVLTGEDTRKISKSGYCDIIISDVGVVDSRAIPLLRATPVRMTSLITAASGG